MYAYGLINTLHEGEIPYYIVVHLDNWFAHLEQCGESSETIAGRTVAFGCGVGVDDQQEKPVRDAETGQTNL